MQPQDARSVEDLAALVRSGSRLKFVFFWGHTPRVPGRVDQSCLSNWYPARFAVDGITYPTSEHFMMAEKARLFADEEIRSQIIAAKSPGEAKSLGRQVSGFEESVWTRHRFEIVVSGNVAKFDQNEDLGEFLRITGSKVLVESSPRDSIWGIGMRKNDTHADNPLQWKGQNLLGFALMEVRARLNR